MADISSYLNKIRTAIYGKDVRSSIADGIDSINKEVEGNTKHVNDTSTDIQNFKNEINQAETIRVQDENERKSSESNRVNEFNSIKNQFDTLKNNSTEATKNANNAASTANSTATNSENRTSQAINDLTTKVNNAITDVKANQIGGENLLSGTQFFDYGWEGGHGTSTRINKTDLFQGCAVQEQWFDWNYFAQVMCYEIGEIYTISCYAKTDKVGSKIYFSLTDNMTAWGMQELTTDWKRYVFSFTPTEGKGTLRIESNCDNWDNNKVYISKIKLEKGSMATDWSPNSFDYEHQIGGSNLLLNTGLDNQIDVIEKTGNLNFTVSNTQSGVQSIYNNKLLFLDNSAPFGDAYITLFKTEEYSLIPNEMYTVSFIYKCQYTGDTPSTSSYIKLILSDDTIRWLQINDIDFKNSGVDWKVSKFTFEVPSNIQRVELRLGFVTNKYGWFAVNGIKLEKGLTATNWCPNYNDWKGLIGGTNLIPNTNFVGAKANSNLIPHWTILPNLRVYVQYGATNYNEPNTIYLSPLDGNGNLSSGMGYLYSDLPKNLEVNSTYTVSFKVQDEENSKGHLVKMEFFDDKWNNVSFEILHEGKVSNGEYLKVIKTFVTPVKFAHSRFTIVHNGCDNTSINGGYLLNIGDIKLEKGYVPTDWNLSPYDLENLQAKQDTDISWTNSHKIDKASVDNAPDCKDCNWFLEPNSRFIWDTGLGEFKNTPIGDLSKDSGIVFEVINYGSEGRLQQEFRKTYPTFETRTWIRSYTSDNGGHWSTWRSNFEGENNIDQNTDFNTITRMGCWKVQSINASTKNSPLTLNNEIYPFGLLNVYESGVPEEHRILQVYYPHQPGSDGYRIPLMRMKNDNDWTDWSYIAGNVDKKDLAFINNHPESAVKSPNSSFANADIRNLPDIGGGDYDMAGNVILSSENGSVNMVIDGEFYGKEGQIPVIQNIQSNRNDINTHTQQIASNSSSINDLYGWVNKNIQMVYISGATSLTLHPNCVYYLDNEHVADITHIDHSAIPTGGKVYFFIASSNQLAHIVFRRDGLCNQDVRVWLPKGQDFWITGNDNGDTIYTLMKIDNAMRFLS